MGRKRRRWKWWLGGGWSQKRERQMGTEGMSVLGVHGNAGWEGEERKGVEGLVERGSGAVW